jgi:hypothetical protein
MKRHALLASLLITACLCNTSDADAQQCSLEQVSAALNNLPCEASGAFVSIESLVKGVTELCEYAPTEESCSECFRRSRGKVKLSVKTLVKLKLLDPSTLGALKPALEDAEDASCLGIGVGDGEDSPEGYNESAPRPPEREDRGNSGRGRGVTDSSPERSEARREGRRNR